MRHFVEGRLLHALGCEISLMDLARELNLSSFVIKHVTEDLKHSNPFLRVFSLD